MSREVPDSMPVWSHPIRIPAGIEITHAEPPFAIAGETSTWRIPFQLSKDVPPGSDLRLQLWGGRNNKGSFTGTQLENADARGLITAEQEDGSRLRIQAEQQAGNYVVALPAVGLKKGQMLTVLLGDQTNDDGGVKVCGERVLNKLFILHVDWGEAKLPQWSGGSVWNSQTQSCIVAVCSMHILGGPIRSIRAYVPATVRPNEEFAVLVRPEDEFGNLSHQRLGPVAVSVNGTALAVRTERVLESTCTRASVRLSSAGVYRLTVRGTDSDLETLSNPTVCWAKAHRVYWGMIHGHTEMSDGTGKIDQYFHQLKNEVGLDFAASADHDHLWETSDEFWEVTCDAVKRWHEMGTFVTFLGYEWAKWRQNGDGDRNVYYLDDDRPLYRSDEGEYPSPPDLFGALARNEERAIVVPHHTGHGGNFCDWKDHDAAYERLVEIFQMRGSYECSEQDGNPVPERKIAVPPYKGGYVRDALVLGWRVGFTAGGDDHDGHWGSEFRFDSGYKQGLMCVEAHERSREAIFAAMYNRRVVATTGARMLLTYRLNGNPMGSELSLRRIPELASRRRLVIEFHGTAAVDHVDVIRNNTVVHSAFATSDKDLCITWEDRDPMDDIWLPAAKFCDHPFAFYYVRVVQQDGEVAWASPVWIDP